MAGSPSRASSTSSANLEALLASLRIGGHAERAAANNYQYQVASDSESDEGDHAISRPVEAALGPLTAATAAAGSAAEVVDLVSSSSGDQSEDDESEWVIPATTTARKRYNLIDSSSGSDHDVDSDTESIVSEELPSVLIPSLAAVLPAGYRPPPALPGPRQLPPPPPRNTAHRAPAVPAVLATSGAQPAAAFKKQREALAHELYAEYNRLVFGGQLPPGLEIRWNNRLATTAGLTHYQRVSPADASLPPLYTAHIELSSKVVDSRAKLERTLSHEMCHVAAWLVDHVAKPPHGAVFKRWAGKAMAVLPQLDIATCHQYDIFYPFRWQCGGCAQEYGRHSNSIDVDRKVCGQCRGRLQFLGRFARDGSPVKARAPTAFSAYVKENFASAKKECLPATPASAVMKKLSARWAAQRQAGHEAVEAEVRVVNLFAQLDL